ncbi:hypothetical protein [Streptomyces sp. WAC04114]|uniref:hypothetical protein n=1 Tax=Streptomyces sp. WAC04114 TaxID=2867961 RepID=UPI001C8B64A7|nr:hypothetical protein [Streptomyces sp. WAC04114]MBX9364141.1 hypothetical protein [Streptomyces sp. WAC04114]
MRIALGIFMSLFGAFFFFIGPMFANRANRTTGGKAFDTYNRFIFRLVGALLVLGGILYAAGIFQ